MQRQCYIDINDGSAKGYNNMLMLKISGKSVLEIMPPVFEANGQEAAFEVLSGTDSETVFASDGFSAKDLITDCKNGLYHISRIIENTGRTARTGKVIFEAITAYTPENTVIPAVSYGNNARSGGCEPHGFSFNGENWIYAYDRVSVPSCTICENSEYVTAVFASDENSESLRSSCSLSLRDGGRVAHRIYYPVTEAPYTYCDHDKMSPRYDEYLTLMPGESFAAGIYITAAVPRMKNFGTAEVLRAAVRVLHREPLPVPDCERLRRLAFLQLGFFETDINGTPAFRNAGRNNPNSDRIYFPYPVSEAGWSGQAMLSARLYISQYARTGVRRYLDFALASLDGWVSSAAPNGLIQINLYRAHSKMHLPPDACNLGWAAAEAARAYKLLREIGIDRWQYLAFAEKLCCFFADNYSESDGFGHKYDMQTGAKVSSGGSAGGFVIPAMLEVYGLTGSGRFLECAKKAFRFYAERDIDSFVCTAGALDCVCIDKESAYPFLCSAVRLYRLTGEKYYLTYAEKYAYYFLSWEYLYSALYPKDSDFEKYGYRTFGGTAVSTQHHAIDPWGEAAVPELLELSDITGDSFFKERASELWRNAAQCINGDSEAVRDGHIIPPGMQSEAFFGARWTRYRKSCEERGHLNDMFVIWPAAYRLMVLDRLAELYPGSDPDTLLGTQQI